MILKIFGQGRALFNDINQSLPKQTLQYNKALQQIIIYNVTTTLQSRFNVYLYLFFFIMCSNGRRNSFWNLKLENSPFSINFMDN